MALETPTIRIPSVKRPDDGELLIGMAVDLKKNLPLYVFGSNPPVQATNAKGQPATQDCLTLLVLEGTRARIGDGTPNGSQPCEIGTLVNVWLARGDRWSWGEARDKRGGKLLDIGDIVKWKFARSEPSQTGGFPRKVTVFQITDPAPEHAELVKRARREHDALKGGTALESTDNAAGGWDSDEEPF